MTVDRLARVRAAITKALPGAYEKPPLRLIAKLARFRAKELATRRPRSKPRRRT